MKKLAVITIASFVSIVAILAIVWTMNLGGLKHRIYVGQIVKMRVAPERLANPKKPQDYGMAYKDVDIVTPDNIRLSAWEIPSADESNKTIIMNHPLTTTRYGALDGLDGVPVEFLPMVKHLHEAGYNVVMYDHRGQGDSDGGLGKTLKGNEAPVGVGSTEWQDVIGSLSYVKEHDQFGDDEIVFLSQCMGANATFLAWHNEPELFDDPQIKSVVAIQPTVSYNMIDRFIQAKTGMDLVDDVLEVQETQYGFGFANAVEDVKSLTVPVLFTQVRKDQYTYDAATNTNDIELIFDATPTAKELIWIGPDESQPFGNGKRFDGYGYFNQYPEQLIHFLQSHFSQDDRQSGSD